MIKLQRSILSYRSRKKSLKSKEEKSKRDNISVYNSFVSQNENEASHSFRIRNIGKLKFRELIKETFPLKDDSYQTQALPIKRRSNEIEVNLGCTLNSRAVKNQKMLSRFVEKLETRKLQIQRRPAGDHISSFDGNSRNEQPRKDSSLKRTLHEQDKSTFADVGKELMQKLSDRIRKEREGRSNSLFASKANTGRSTGNWRGFKCFNGLNLRKGTEFSGTVDLQNRHKFVSFVDENQSNRENHNKPSMFLNSTMEHQKAKTKKVGFFCCF